MISFELSSTLQNSIKKNKNGVNTNVKGSCYTFIFRKDSIIFFRTNVKRTRKIFLYLAKGQTDENNSP